MQIGVMPEGVLYDPSFKGLAAESIYDFLLKDVIKSSKLRTFRGYGKGDIFGEKIKSNGKGMEEIEEFYRNALRQGLVYHEMEGRGFLPIGLVEEIRAMGMPSISWDVKLARWFESCFPYQERRYSYARPSRRQSSSPDILRPRLTDCIRKDEGRTFGVVIDTSGSMSVELLAMALGSIASYANSREVERVRVIFCDAVAYDAGYLSVDELAGRVEVRGRGGLYCSRESIV